MKKIIGIIIGCILIVALMVGLIVLGSSSEEPVNNNTPVDNEQTEEPKNQAPSKLDENEKEVSDKKQQELFNFIPKVYTEGIAPFDSAFMLDAVMNKIIDTNEEMDFSVTNVDNTVKKIFGNDAVINKDEVSEPNVAKSLFYYSKEAESYAVIPVGYEGIFEYQIFKNATETDQAYYVYTYTLIGGYSYDEDSITQDEFGDVSYENAKVQVIVGDKDGNDLVHVFENYTYMYEQDTWLQLYSNKMPIFRYTLTKMGNGYYLTEVEQINY
ncbi:MAG: hypothetical protein IJ272_07325 [Clostridia bacterium]|nr:hypothetical protein [Clostridia bacterium]